MSYLTQSFEELQTLVIAALEAETSLTFNPNTETITEFYSRCLGQNNAWLTKSEGRLLADLNVAMGGSSVSHLRYSYARLLDTLSGTIGGGGAFPAASAIFDADFVGGRYFAGGATRSLAEVIEGNNDWWPFDYADVTDEGFTVGANNAGRGFVIKPTYGDALIAQDISIILEYALEDSGFAASDCTIAIVDLPNYVGERYCSFSKSETSTLSDHVDSELFSSASATAEKGAFTFASDRLAATRAGLAAVEIADPANLAPPTHIAIALRATGEEGAVHLTRVTIYPVVSNVELQTLTS